MFKAFRAYIIMSRRNGKIRTQMGNSRLEGIKVEIKTSREIKDEKSHKEFKTYCLNEVRQNGFLLYQNLTLK